MCLSPSFLWQRKQDCSLSSMSSACIGYRMTSCRAEVFSSLCRSGNCSADCWGWLSVSLQVITHNPTARPREQTRAWRARFGASQHKTLLSGACFCRGLSTQIILRFPLLSGCHRSWCRSVTSLRYSSIRRRGREFLLCRQICVAAEASGGRSVPH